MMITFTLHFTALQIQTSVGGVVGEGVGGGGHVGVALHQRGHGQPQRLGQEQGGNVCQSRLHTPRVSRVSRDSCPPRLTSLQMLTLSCVSLSCPAEVLSPSVLSDRKVFSSESAMNSSRNCFFTSVQFTCFTD